MSFFSLIYSTGLKERSRFRSLVKVETEESGKNTFYHVIPAKESASFPVSLKKESGYKHTSLPEIFERCSRARMSNL